MLSRHQSFAKIEEGGYDRPEVICSEKKLRHILHIIVGNCDRSKAPMCRATHVQSRAGGHCEKVLLDEVDYLGEDNESSPSSRRPGCGNPHLGAYPYTEPPYRKLR